jgi:hypothetical protein
MTNDASDAGPDKAQVGLTPAANKALESLMETGWFPDKQDAYRLAIAVALARGLPASASELQGIRTAYNFAGGVDRDGRLRQLIAVLAPKEARRPAAYAERLAQAGLMFLHEHLVTMNRTLAEVLEPQEISQGDVA